MIALAESRLNLMPTRALALLMGIGVLDLISTAYLHAHGLIVELNPLMRPLIEHSEFTFAAVKGMTLLVAYAVMVWYARTNLAFVRRVCTWGSGAYLLIWVVWFLKGA
jgi:hypothetical protein